MSYAPLLLSSLSSSSSTSSSSNRVFGTVVSNLQSQNNNNATSIERESGKRRGRDFSHTDKNNNHHATATTMMPFQVDQDCTGVDFKTEIVLITNDNTFHFKMSRQAAKSCCNLLNKMIENEDEDSEIKLPVLCSAKVLPLVMQYCEYHKDSKPAALSQPLRQHIDGYLDQWDKDFIYNNLVDKNDETKHEALLEVMAAAHYLDNEDLLNLCCAKVGSMMQDKNPEQIRNLFNLPDDFTPEQKARNAEELKALSDDHDCHFHVPLVASQSSRNCLSPLLKVIFNQRAAKYFCRSVKDILIFNSVCQDFQVTIQDYHTFNLIFFKIYSPEQFRDTVQAIFKILRKLPSSEWILIELTTVNQRDEDQQELVRKVLERVCFIMQYPRITSSLLQHVLDSCVKLGIIRRFLRNGGINCIMIAAANKLPADCFKLLLEYCHKHTNIKTMLEAVNNNGSNCIMIASMYQLPFDSFKLLLEYCVEHTDDMMDMFEAVNNDEWNCILLAAAYKLPSDSFKLLLEYCAGHTDIQQILETVGIGGWNCIMAAAFSQVPLINFILLIAFFPSNDSFRSVLSQRSSDGRTLFDRRNWNVHGSSIWNDEVEAQTRSLLQDPQCWEKCIAECNIEPKDEESASPRSCDRHLLKSESPARRRREEE